MTFSTTVIVDKQLQTSHHYYGICHTATSPSLHHFVEAFFTLGQLSGTTAPHHGGTLVG